MTIVSHKHKFIFIKTRKTAGTSIEAWLMPHLGPNDIVATSGDQEPLKHSWWMTPNKTADHDGVADAKRHLQDTGWLPMRFSEHLAGKSIRDLVGPEIWSTYYKFTAERNPWDRFLSMWRWRQHMAEQSISIDDYLDAIEQRLVTPFFTDSRRRWSNWTLYSDRGRPIVDHIIRFENLEQGFVEALHTIGLTWDGKMPREKVGMRTEADRFSVLTPEQRARIANLFHLEINHFGYTEPELAA